LADSKPKQNMGAESNEKRRVGDAAHSLNPGPQFGPRLRGEEVRLARGEANLDDGVQNHPNCSRDERGPKKDFEQRASTDAAFEALEVL
jgi:hypothetical protein